MNGNNVRLKRIEVAIYALILINILIGVLNG